MSSDGLLSMNERLTEVEREQRYMREKFEREIDLVKEKQLNQGKSVSDLKSDQALDRQRISAMELQLNKIEENTTYTRRQMTGILVGAVATGIIGGAITIIYTVVGGGLI